MSSTLQENMLRQLDSIRQLKENAEEEYRQYLDAYEREFGREARERYEEEYV